MSLYCTSGLHHGMVLDLSNEDDFKALQHQQRTRKNFADNEIILNIEELGLNTICISVLKGEGRNAEIKRRQDLDFRARSSAENFSGRQT